MNLRPKSTKPGGSGKCPVSSTHLRIALTRAVWFDPDKIIVVEKIAPAPTRATCMVECRFHQGPQVSMIDTQGSHRLNGSVRRNHPLYKSAKVLALFAPSEELRSPLMSLGRSSVRLDSSTSSLSTFSKPPPLGNSGISGTRCRA